MATRPHMRLLPALLALACSGCSINLNGDEIIVREEARFAVDGPAELILETFDGSVSVTSSERPEILVEIHKRGPDREQAASLEVRTSQDGNRVRLEAPDPGREGFVGIGHVITPSVSFVVTVPRSTAVTARTRDGSITLDDLEGTIDVRSGDGSIKASRITGDMRAETGDGSMRIDDVEGRVSLDSGDGSIRASGRFDALHARTRDGSIDIEVAAGSRMSDDWDLTTGDGTVVVRLPSSFDAEVDAQSGDGSVRSEIGGLERKGDDGRESLRGRLGQGGHQLRLRSGDGSIRIVER